MTKRNPGRPRLTWAEVVLKALQSAGAPVTLSYLNSYVEARAPKLLAANPHWQAKIRQVVQRLRDQGLAENVSKGVWTATRNESHDATGRSA